MYLDIFGDTQAKVYYFPDLKIVSVVIQCNDDIANRAKDLLNLS